jgi:NAD(P) transhydrogenase
VKYDLVVIGAGPAGEKGAAQAAYFGKSVAIVDPSPRPGGIAMSTAGIPTKTLREGAIYLSGLGLSAFAAPAPGGQDAWSLLMARKLEVSDFLIKAVERNLVRHRVDRILGRARLLPGPAIEVARPGGEPLRLETDSVLIACGSRPRHLDGVPMSDPDVHDVETILSIDGAPGSLVVVGDGSAGCEYASIFAALGVRVTIVSPAEHLLPALDGEIARVLAECFNGLGIRVIPLTPVQGVTRSDGALEVKLGDGRTISAAKVLVAVGRCPSVEGLGLAQAGVEVTPAGWIRVDGRYATTAPGVFAAGDVIGPPALASTSMEQARVAVCHAFGIPFKTEADHFRPSYTFSIPEAASVGLTEEDVKASGVAYEVGRSSFMTNAKARISGFPDGLVKLLFRVPDKALLGVHIVGELASELIHIGQFVLKDGGTIDPFIDATFAVPTRSEAYKYAAYDGLARLTRRLETQRGR